MSWFWHLGMMRLRITSVTSELLLSCGLVAEGGEGIDKILKARGIISHDEGNDGEQSGETDELIGARNFKRIRNCEQNPRNNGEIDEKAPQHRRKRRL